MTQAATKPPDGKRGRPSALTPETTTRVRLALLSLNNMEDSFELAGIDASTGQRWMAKGRKQKKGEYRDFYNVVEGARRQIKDSLVRKVTNKGLTDPKMALEILARRFPKEWAKTQKIDLTDKTAPRRVGMREKVLDRLERIEERLTRSAPAAAIAALAPALEEDEDGA